jgi:hypothetical protein
LGKPRETLAAATIATGLLLLPAPSALGSRLVDVRVGERGSATRVVLELDEAAEHRVEGPAGTESPELRVALAAEALPRTLEYPTGLVGSIAVEPRGSGAAAVSVRLRDGSVAVRESQLADPPRIVLDLQPSASPPARPEPRRLVDLRVGEHEGFTRVVFELDGEAEHHLERAQGESEILLALAASGSARTIRRDTGLLESVALEPRGDGTSIGRIQLRDAPVEAVEVRRLVLSDPPRIVVDARAEPASGAAAAAPPPAAGAAPPAPSARELVDVRVGEHPTFTRVVFQFASPTAHAIERLAADPLVVNVSLAAPSSPRTLTSRGGIATFVTIGPDEAGGSRAQIRLRAPDVEIRSQELSDPPRLVLDLSRGSPVARAPTPEPARALPDVAAAPSAPAPASEPDAEPAAPPSLPGSAPDPRAPGAEDAAALPTDSDGIAYDVSGFSLQFAQEHADQPPIDELLDLEVDLGRTTRGWVALRAGVPTETIALRDVPRLQERRFYASAVQVINTRIVEEINRRGVAGVLVLPHEADIDRRSRRDLRPPERTELRLVIWTGRLIEFRTFASGAGVAEADRIDSARHARIKERSPIQPGDLLRKQELDDYIARLNRHPGRRVDYGLSEASQVGGMYLDFLVAENRPLSLYVQGANTGTEETSRWRQRFGLSHTQLTGHDDVLQLDFITGGFDGVFATLGSYEAPLWSFDRVRWRVGGLWSRYDASQFGFVESTFEGGQWEFSGQLLANVLQEGPFFVDIFAGPRYQHLRVENDPLDSPAGRQEESVGFFLPEVGIRVEHASDRFELHATVANEWNLPGIAGTSSHELAELGRTDVREKHFSILHWNAGASFYLEPLLFPSGFRDPNNRWMSTLAHEIAFSSQGQHSWGERLIPQHLAIAGGVYTVRGYPQSSVSSDGSVVGRVEYLFHLPALFAPNGAPIQLPWIGPFRWAPQQAYGRADWDFAIRGFLDVGRTLYADRVAGEENQTLLGAGAGAELRLWSNLILRFDWGRALRTIQEGDGELVRRGNDQFYFVGTLVR